jgi:hypothetical protein
MQTLLSTGSGQPSVNATVLLGRPSTPCASDREENLRDSTCSDADLSIRVFCACGEGEEAVNWSSFLELFDAHTGDVTSVCFLADFRGSSHGRKRVAVDSHIRRVLSSYGVDHLHQIVGVFGPRNAREM